MGTTIYQEVSNGDSIGFLIVNGSLYAYYKTPLSSWTLIGSAIDPNPITQQGYLLINIFGTNISIDDFGGGSL